MGVPKPPFTNATKAQGIVVVNTLLAVLAAFVDLSSEQTAAITAAVNALFGLWIALTYKDSPKRVDEPQERVVRR